MVPEGWISSQVGDHVDLLSGFAFKSSEYSENTEDIRLLRGDNIGQGFLRWRDAKRWDHSQYDDLSKYHLKVGDFVIAMDRTWVSGGLKVAEVQSKDLPSLLLQRVSRLRSKSSLDQRLLNFLINSHRFEQYVKGVQTETAVPHISAKQIKEFPILLPPLAEQRKIADILSTWDRAIETTEALLATARTQKRALMQSLLTGKRRFPEFEGEEWREVRLGDVGKIVSGGTPDSTKPEFWDGDVQWATPTDITKLRSRFIEQTARQITEAGLSSSSAKLLPQGAILVCTRATIGELAIATIPICTNQGFKNLVLNQGFDADFVFYLLQFYKNELIRYSCGSTFLELSKKDFEKRSFIFPSLEEQRRIASTLNAAEAEIADYRAGIEKLRTEKKALMQQLLTGKRRVVV